jgi:cytochrome c553
MKTLSIVLSALALVAATPVLAGDVAAGKQKAAACVICHGSENFGGIFYTLQLAGRNADKLAIKTNKYKSFKILHPVMNMATVLYGEKDIEDVSAYYQSIGKPFFTSPLFTIKGDDEAKPAAAVAPATPAAVVPVAVATK